MKYTILCDYSPFRSDSKIFYANNFMITWIKAKLWVLKHPFGSARVFKIEGGLKK